MVKIYLADVTFYYKQKKGEPERQYVVENVVCKRIPMMFHLNEGDVYKRAIRGLAEKTIQSFQDNGNIKRFSINYKKEL